MIVLDEGHRRFQLRACAVILDGERLLVHRAVGDAFWALPGGRVEIGEEAAATVAREMVEECGSGVEVGRLLWICENYFSYNGRDFHELGLYFLAHFPPECPLTREPTFRGQEGALDLEFRWVPFEELGREPLYPIFLAEGVRALPESPRHIVEYDEPLPA